MANRLKKVAAVLYSAGSPAQPATEGYYTTTRVYIPAGNEVLIATYYDKYGELKYELISGRFIPAHYDYVQVWVPATPAVPAVDPVFSYTAIAGWNGGARSRELLVADGFVSFYTSVRPRGVVAGLTSQDNDTTPGDIEFGFYVHGTAIEVYEDGVSKYVFTTPADGDETELKIRRELGRMTYIVGAEEYVSGKTSNQPMMLDATLYSTGDFVDDPVFTQYTPYGGGATTVPAYVAYGTQGVKANGGSVLLPIATWGFSGFVGSGMTIMPAYSCVGSIAGYTYGSSVTPVPRVSGNGGYPAVELQYGMDWLTSQETSGHGLTGEIGGGGSVLGAISGIGSDAPYSYGGVSLLAPMVIAYDYGSSANEQYEVEALFLQDVYTAVVNHSASYVDSLTLQDVWTSTVQAGDTYFDSLLLGSTLSAQQAMSAVIMSLLALSDSSVASSTLDRQYAVNIATGAVSPYTGFGFSAYARCGQETFGSKTDGLYRIRRGDDNGTPISADIDLGELDIGSRTKLKHIEDMFLGVDTDGNVTVTTKVDGVEYTYDVLRRGELMRAVLSRSLRGRSWNVRINVADASILDLEFVEIHTGTTLRWSN